MKKVKVYMKSGNVVRFNADEVTMKKDECGKVKRLEWSHEGYMDRGQLFMIDVDNIEAIVVDFVGRETKSRMVNGDVVKD